ncbi:MAG: thioredoxin family protein [Lentisphaeria bacterium]|nr:thioredoxin family protein [Lentisphaeria bacterium]
MKFRLIKTFLFSLLLCVTPFLKGKEAENFIWSLENDKIILKVAKSCYVYADSVRITAIGENGQTLELIAPKKTNYSDEMSGDVLIYGSGNHVWQAPQKIKGAKLEFQGCQAPADGQSGICFMPQDLSLGNFGEIKGKSSDSSPSAITNLLDEFTVAAMLEGEVNKEEFIRFLTQDTSKELPIADPLASKGIYLMILLTFVGGLLLNFTPCILPMIPINLAIIGASGDSRKGVIRGLIYGLGMMLAYGVLGLMVIFGGAKFGALNSSSIFNFVIGVIFILLGLAMLDVVHLDLSKYQNKIDFNRWKNSQNFLAFIMGITAALLAGACVAPVVLAMLLATSQMYNNGEYYGLLLPFIFGAGMALPWPIAGKTLAILPKPGRYMIYIKYIFAIAIFAMAIYYIVIGFKLQSPEFNSQKEIAKLETALDEAKNSKKAILIDFWASWCKNCSSMKKNVIQSAEVQELIKREFIFCEFQAEKFDNEEVREILNYFNIKGLPAFVILSPPEQK